MPVVWTCLALVFVFHIVFGAGTSQARSLIYKNYIIRYDRGWDILCEPYVVQKNDWVLKIFRQKGEIAHTDFREFLGIVKRLNPHIKNIDMIRPGQTIDIPLQKLEHGSLPGQSSGIVSIPFVSLSKVTDVVKQHSETHKVRWGDTVSKLIARHYGRYGTKSYNEGIALFKAANPQIKDINRIYAGQQVYLPSPGIRDQNWYAEIKNEKGEIRQTADRQKPPAETAAPETSIAAAAAEPPVPKSVLNQVADTVGGTLQNKGTYYIPRPEGNDFELDLSQNPMLSLQETTKIVFSQEDRVMGQSPADIEKLLPNSKVVTYSEDESVDEIVGSIFAAVQAEGNQDLSEDNEVSFTDNGIQVSVHARWIKPEDDQRTRCIIPVKSSDELTPESMRRYLEQNGIVLKEIMPGQKDVATTSPNAIQRHVIQNVLALAPKNQKDFVRSLARNLGFTFSPNVSISFPYAGIQVQAYVNLLSTGKGTEVLIDFGDLYGDAVSAIRQSGPQIIQIQSDDSYTLVVQKLFSALQLDYMENPTFFAAKRPARYNTSITIPGLLYQKSETQKVLLSSATLPAAVTDLLSTEDVDVLIW